MDAIVPFHLTHFTSPASAFLGKWFCHSGTVDVRWPGAFESSEGRGWNT